MKIEGTYPLEFYTSEDGFICIKQDDGRIGDEQIILVHPTQFLWLHHTLNLEAEKLKGESK